MPMVLCSYLINAMKATVILPTYNESASIGTVLENIFSHAPQIDVLVVDDNSPDGTALIVEKLQARFPQLFLLKRKGKEGLGKAYSHAMKYVLSQNKYDAVLMMDADCSHDPKYIPTLIRRMEEVNADVVTGSRYVQGGGVEGWEKWRKYLSKNGNLYTRVLTGVPIYDVTAGYNLIRTNTLKRIDLDRIGSSGYAFILELKCALYYLGARMVEIPIIFKERMGGESKISNHIIREGVYAPIRIAIRNRLKRGRTVLATYCPGCNAEVPVTIFTHKNEHEIVQCSRCLTLKVHPIPESTREIYNEEYFSGAQHGFGYVNYDADKEPMRPTFHKYIDIIKTLHLENQFPLSLFDIGAATGYFLDIARERGFDVQGIEISQAATQMAQKKGLKVEAVTLEDYAQKANDKFGVITMLDVLEHVVNPRESLVTARKLLDKNGIIIINTPDASSLYARILGASWHLIIPPEHVYCLSREAVHTMLADAGFKTEISTTIGKKFTLEYVFLMLYKWLKLSIFLKLSKFFAQNKILAKISLPINLRDNMFVVARRTEL